MKNNALKSYPAIRETFVCLAALADYLGRSERYCSMCLNHAKEFSPAVTAEGERLDGMDDRTVYLPLSQLKFTENYNHEVIIHCPEWLVKKNNLNWHRISEIEAID